VMDWTTTGCALPTSTPPTSTLTVARRRGRRESGLAMASGASAEAPDDVDPGDPDQEDEEEHEPDEVGQPLRLEAEPGAQEALDGDHQHPTAIERRERQDVHDREVGRQDARDVEGE